jgi:hypothetical protein
VSESLLVPLFTALSVGDARKLEKGGVKAHTNTELTYMYMHLSTALSAAIASEIQAKGEHSTSKYCRDTPDFQEQSS